MHYRAWGIFLTEQQGKHMTNMDLVKQNIPVLEVRVLDAIRKSSFRVRRLTNFPLVDTLNDLRKEWAIVLPDLPNVDKCQIGYVLDRNKKFAIDMDIDVKNAYDYFISGYQIWLDPDGRQPNTKSSRRVDERGKYILHIICKSN